MDAPAAPSDPSGAIAPVAPAGPSCEHGDGGHASPVPCAEWEAQ